MDKPKNIKYIEYFIDIVGEEMTHNYPLPICPIENDLVKIGSSIITNKSLAILLVTSLNKCCNC